MTVLLYDLVGADPRRPFSPHCWKVRMALAHKGLPFEARLVTFREVRAIEGGPDRRVPVIRDGERVVEDSFAIALHLEEAYPDRPTLFGGEGGQAVTRFVEAYAQKALHPAIAGLCLFDIHDLQDEPNREHFRRTREAAFGKCLEDVQTGTVEERAARVRAALEPLRMLLSNQPFLGGQEPLFADYILFGALQWIRVVRAEWPLQHSDPVMPWFERCLDLHGGIGREAPSAREAA